MDDRRKRLKIRAWRRGFREMDLVLGYFVDRSLETLTDRQLDQFEALLNEDDHELYGWIIGRSPTPAEHDNEVMDSLKSLGYFADTLWTGRAS